MARVRRGNDIESTVDQMNPGARNTVVKSTASKASNVIVALL